MMDSVWSGRRIGRGAGPQRGPVSLWDAWRRLGWSRQALAVDAGAIPVLAVGAALIPTVLIPALHGRLHAAVVAPYPHDLAQVNFAGGGGRDSARGGESVGCSRGRRRAGVGCAVQRCGGRIQGADFGLCEPRDAGGADALARDEGVPV